MADRDRNVAFPRLRMSPFGVHCVKRPFWACSSLHSLRTLVLGIGAALNAPAWQASLPELVPRDELTAAIALNGIQFNLARAIGPALGGVLIAAIGVGSAFIINAASFLGVVLLLFFWRREPTKSTLPAERLVGAIKAGIRYTRYSRP